MLRYGDSCSKINELLRRSRSEHEGDSLIAMTEASENAQKMQFGVIDQNFKHDELETPERYNSVT